MKGLMLVLAALVVTQAWAAKEETPLLRKTDRGGGQAVWVCSYWENQTLTLDKQSGGIWTRESRKLELAPGQLDVLKGKIASAQAAPWVDHRGMFKNMDPNHWARLWEAGGKPISAYWGAIWLGERDSVPTTDLIHFLNNNCGF